MTETPFPSRSFSQLVHLTREADDERFTGSNELAASIDWPALTKLAQYHRVDSLVAGRLAGIAPESVPKASGAYFQKQRSGAAKKILAREASLVKVSKTLQGADIDHILLKGAAVADRFYLKDDIRQSIDVDIWIAPDKLLPAIDALKALNHRLLVPEFDITTKNLSAVQRIVNAASLADMKLKVHHDVHWRLNDVPGLLDWDFETLRARTDTIRLGDTSVPVFAPEDQLIYLYTHGAKHAWFRLKWMADIYRIRKRLPEGAHAAVQQRMKETGLDAVFRTANQLHNFLYAEGHPLGTASSQKYVQFRLSQTSKETELNLGNFKAILAQIKYRLGLRESLKYRLSTLAHYCANLNDVPRLRLSGGFFGAYIIAGPVLGLFRLLKRSLDRKPVQTHESANS